MKTDSPNIPLKGSKNLRTGRRSLPGQIYLLTTATFNREPIFQNPEAAAITLNSLKYLEKQNRLTLDAAVIMPDHVHMVAGIVSDNLPDLMRSFKGFTARAVNKLLSWRGHVLQPAFYDHAVHRDEDACRLACYIAGNPIHSGTVNRVAHYPLWDALGSTRRAPEGTHIRKHLQID